MCFCLCSCLIVYDDYILWSAQTLHTEALLLGFLWVSGHNISVIGQYITLFYVCLFKDTLLNIYCWFTNFELPHSIHAWIKFI